jgi:hypothetical protein
VLELDFRDVKYLFFPRRDLNSHHWYWKVRFAICIASVAIQVFTKLLFSFSDVLKAINCTFQEVNNIFCLIYIYIYSHPSWLSGNPKVWKMSWWELTSPLDLPTMVSVKNVIRNDVWRVKTFNAHKNSAAHIQEQNSSYTAMPTARQKILFTSWNVQFRRCQLSPRHLSNFWISRKPRRVAIYIYIYIGCGRVV